MTFENTRRRSGKSPGTATRSPTAIRPPGLRAGRARRACTPGRRPTSSRSRPSCSIPTASRPTAKTRPSTWTAASGTRPRTPTPASLTSSTPNSRATGSGPPSTRRSAPWTSRAASTPSCSRSIGRNRRGRRTSRSAGCPRKTSGSNASCCTPSATPCRWRPASTRWTPSSRKRRSRRASWAATSSATPAGRSQLLFDKTDNGTRISPDSTIKNVHVSHRDQDLGSPKNPAGVWFRLVQDGNPVRAFAVEGEKVAWQQSRTFGAGKAKDGFPGHRRPDPADAAGADFRPDEHADRRRG